MWLTFFKTKNRLTYQRALQILTEQQKELCSRSIMYDSEKPFYPTLKYVSGKNVNIKGCYLHLSQSIWHRIQEQNLVKMYRENEELRLKMRMLIALAFVPPNLVLHYFEVLSNDIPRELEPMYDYFEVHQVHQGAFIWHLSVIMF